MDMYPRKRNDDEMYEDNRFEDDQQHSLSSRDPRNRYTRRKSPLSTILFIVALIALVSGITLYTYVFDSATITVIPKYKDVADIGRPFLFSKDGVDSGAIPFLVQTTSLSKSKTLALSESRKVEAKASGHAIIYNNYDALPQKLIKNTRFESSKGKIYRINQSVEVPGKKGTTPGSIDVILYADSNGADYNIDNTVFTIPGFKGTPREQAFYAKSKGAISGGSSGTMALVALADLNAAKDALAIELAHDIQTEVMKIKKEGYIPMYTAVEVTYDDNEEEVLKGVTAEYKVTATGNLILANAPKLAEAVAKTFGDYDNQPVRLDYIDTLSYTRKQSDHIVGASSTLSILVEGKPRVIWESDINAIKEMVIGKNRDEFKPLMKTINSIESAEISFSPVWISRFPKEISKIAVIESLPKR